MMGMAVHVVKSDGVLALYNGLSASLCRQVCLQAVCSASLSLSGENLLLNVGKQS